MTTDIKELVKRLREVFVEDRGHGHTTEWTRNLDGHEAADALEALAGEVEGVSALLRASRADEAELIRERDRLAGEVAQVNRAAQESCAQMNDALGKATAERDRLKAALERLRDCDWVITLPDRMDAVREIAREALEGEE